jgi:TPR repeat protein
VEELRKHGVLQAGPLCRAALPAGPEKIFEDGVRLYVTLLWKVESGNASWRTLTASDKKLMAEVVAMWTTAANQGHANAQYNLGNTYHYGEGVSRDHQEAARWTRKAADQGHVNAQYNIGVVYRDGEGFSRDYQEAARWIRKAADQGHANAQFSLGLMYGKGQGVLEDYKEMMRWISQAACQGKTSAQETLAKFF